MVNKFQALFDERVLLLQVEGNLTSEFTNHTHNSKTKYQLFDNKVSKNFYDRNDVLEISSLEYILTKGYVMSLTGQIGAEQIQQGSSGHVTTASAKTSKIK